MEIKHLPGVQNFATYALSRLPILTKKIDQMPTLTQETYAINNIIERPVSFDTIQKHQQMNQIKAVDSFLDKYQLKPITQDNKIKTVIPQTLI